MTEFDSLIDVGIDVGMRRLAYAWPAYGLSGSFDLGKGSSGMTRDAELRAMQQWLRAVVPDGVRLWVDQAFAGAGAVAMAQRLTETISAVMTAQDWAISPIVVHSATWKSQVIGNHKATKDEIQAFLEVNYPQLASECQTEDEYDAMVIGLYGKGRAEGRILPPEPKPPKRRKSRT